ncbi:MAG TPA: hypothetical protein VLN49_09905 [Gemmatimonadaceae bacterium]|nr:hypothetical protein [Gemmatimonadaceae bacterium]
MMDFHIPRRWTDHSAIAVGRVGLLTLMSLTLLAVGPAGAQSLPGTPPGTGKVASATTLEASQTPTTYPAALAALPATAQETVRAILDSASAAHLPLAPLQSKVIEGVAKRAAPDRIVAVVSGVADGLRVARTAYTGTVADAELTAAGAAVQAGVPPDRLRELRRSLPAERSATQTFVVLTDLTRRGVSVDDGVRELQRLLALGSGDEMLDKLRADVARDVAGGVQPGLAVSRRVDAFVHTAGSRPPVSQRPPSPESPTVPPEMNP